MMDQPPLTSLDGSRRRSAPERRLRPLYSRDSAHSKHSTPHQYQSDDFIVVKVEDDDKVYKPCKEEEISPESSTEHGMTRRTRRRLKAEEEGGPVIKDEELSPEINAAGSRKRNRPERCPRPIYTEDSAQEEHPMPHRYPGDNSIHGDEEAYLRDTEPCADEEMFTEIGAEGAYFTSGRYIYSEPSNMEVEEGRLYADLDSSYANDGRRGAWKRGREWNRHTSMAGSRPAMGRARSARHQQVEEFDEYDDEEATTLAGSNRLRNVRFSERENMMLVEQVISNFDILVGKLAAKTETSMKNLVWRQITDSVNSVGSFKRSVPHCKRRYQDIKRSIRKKCQEQRKHGAGSGSSQSIFLHTYEGILKPYIHIRGGGRVRGAHSAQMEEESESDPDIQESPPASPRSLEEPVEVGRFSPEPEEEAPPVFPEPRSLEESGEPSQDNQGESEAATSQLAPSSCSSEPPLPSNGPEPWQIPNAQDRQRSFGKEAKKGKLDDHGIKRFLREQTLHRKTLMRKLNALHEDVNHLTQTLAKATSEQNGLLGRIVSALEERNRIETEQHKTLQNMSETLERTCVHRGLSSQSTDD